MSPVRLAALPLLALLLAAPAARAADLGEEVDVTAGVVTGLSCALQVRETGELKRLNACPPAEVKKALVVFDVAERAIYRISGKALHRYQLEGAFGGGSVDFTGKAVQVDAAQDIATVEVASYSVAKKKKAGAFKGCL